MKLTITKLLPLLALACMMTLSNCGKEESVLKVEAAVEELTAGINDNRDDCNAMAEAVRKPAQEIQDGMKAIRTLGIKPPGELMTKFRGLRQTVKGMGKCLQSPDVQAVFAKIMAAR